MKIFDVELLEGEEIWEETLEELDNGKGTAEEEKAYYAQEGRENE